MQSDDDTTWQDLCLNAIRLSIGVVAECSSLIAEANSPAGWTIADLRSATHDLLQALMDADEESAGGLLVEIRALLIEVLRLCG